MSGFFSIGPTACRCVFSLRMRHDLGYLGPAKILSLALLASAVFQLGACGLDEGSEQSVSATAIAEAESPTADDGEEAADGASAAEAVELYPSEDSWRPPESPNGIGTASDARPALLQPKTRPDDQLLILEVRLRDMVLNEGMFGYLDEGGLLLPLSEFARTLEFPISVDPANGRANGWYIEEGQLFSLDILTREVVIDGVKRRFNRQLVELHEDDIYVDTRLLADWFPLDIEFDLANLLVEMQSRKPLPVEQRMARETRRSRALAQRARVEEQFEEIDAPYAWADWPMFNLSAQTGFSRDSTGESFFESQYGLLANGDFLKHSASLFVGGNQDKGVSDVRFRMGRKDPDGEMLGYLRATGYSLGDIVTPPVELVARSRFGRGAELSSFPLSRSGTFDSTTLVGELPLGWEVELYRNGVLLDFRVSRSDGRYEFSDVPLLFGLNILQLQFFGPQGQYREETSRILVGPEQVEPGGLNFRVAASQQDERLIPIDNTDSLSPIDQELQGEPRGSLELEYGATKHISLAASIATIPLIEGRKTYGGVGMRFGVGPMYGHFDVVRDNEGGTAAKLGTQFNLPLNLLFLAEQGFYNDFSSEEIQDDGDLPVRTTEGRLDGVLPLWQGQRLPFSFTGAYEKSESGASSLELTNRLSFALGRLSTSNNIQWRRNKSAAGVTTSANGNLLVGGRVWGTGIRGDLAYTLEPDSEIVSAAVTSEWLFGSGFSTRAGVTHGFADDITTVSAGVSRRFDYFSLGLNGSYANDDSATMLLTLSMSAARNPHNGDWSVRAGAVAEKGAAAARVYLDNDLDGEFSEGDEPIEGAVFETGSWLAKEESNEDGIAMLTGLPPHSKLSISLPPTGLEDPYWVAEPEGYTVPLRPGVAIPLNFPIVVTGEIDGVVALRQGARLVEVSDAVIQLLDQDGQVVDETRSAFDGFYLLERVRPGSYVVRLDPEQLRRLGLTAPAPEPVEIRGDGTIAGGIDFVIEQAL